MSLIFLTQEQLRKIVTGKNKAFITRTINKQKKYGNTDIFDVIIDTQDKSIKIGLGESQGRFVKDYITGKYVHDYGNLYHLKECADVVNELAIAINEEVESYV